MSEVLGCLLLLSLFSFPMSSFLYFQVCLESLFLIMMFPRRVVVVVAVLRRCVGVLVFTFLGGVVGAWGVWVVRVVEWSWECRLV